MARFPSVPITAETRRRMNEDDRRWPIKFGMRAVSTFFAFIAMILFAVTTSLSKKNYGGNDWVDGLPLAPVCRMLLIDGSEDCHALRLLKRGVRKACLGPPFDHSSA